MIRLTLPCIVIFALGFIQSADRTANFPKTMDYVEIMPEKDNLWVFILAGQSNMAGRGRVEPEDTLAHPRILTINSDNEFIRAKEPLHFYEPRLTGLDCGLSFARQLINEVDEQVTILLLPAAIGGSSIRQWLDDDHFRGVSLLSNFREKMELAKKHGTVKGILWHQGESDANRESIPVYEENLSALFTRFRGYAGDESLPILMGDIGIFREEQRANRTGINDAIRRFTESDANAYRIPTGDLDHIGDFVHFDSKSLRTMGKRYAGLYSEHLKR
ncbi:MAG: sialate O-acetylesterase [Balneolales bacterium]